MPERRWDCLPRYPWYGCGVPDNLDSVSAVLNELVHMCIGCWFQALGPATANAQVSKGVTEEETTRSPRVSDRSLCLLPMDVAGIGI